MLVPSESISQITALLCRQLRDLARREDQLASEVAAHLPYWAPVPDAVLEHRAAARALRAEVSRLRSTIPDPVTSKAS